MGDLPTVGCFSRQGLPQECRITLLENDRHKIIETYLNAYICSQHIEPILAEVRLEFKDRIRCEFNALKQ
jgi:hypothetical protein